MLTEEAIKARFDNDCQILVDGILGALDKVPEAILLCGGYGRGEGAWFEDEGGNPSPYNDYDLAVITEKPFSRERYTKLRKRLANEIGINWVDIDCYTKAKLSRMTSTIHNVDLFEASTVLWGNNEWKKGFKQPDASKIGKEDIIRLYTTRMWTFLGSLEKDPEALDVDSSRFFCNQMAKAVLAGCDMRLVANKRYTTSYRERVTIVSKDYIDNPEYVKLCEWAISEKLHPSSRVLTACDVHALYNNVYSYFMDSMRYSMGSDAESYLNPDKTKRYQILHTNYPLIFFYGYLRGNKKVKKSNDIFLAQNYVLRAYSPTGGHNSEYLRKASDILLKYHYIAAPETEWRKLCFLTSCARNNI